MQSPVKMYQLLMLLLIVFVSSCAAKHILMPMPVVGIDIVEVNKGDTVPFNGTLFSPEYLTSYLQWKCTNDGKC